MDLTKIHGTAPVQPSLRQKQFDDASSVSLFKFRSSAKLKRDISIITKNELYCSEINDLNDPMEAYIPFAVTNWSNRASRRFQGSIMRQIDNDLARYRICSLTQQCDDPVMWAHYAEGFCGFAVEFQVSKKEIPEDSFLRLVSYGTEFPVYEILSEPETYPSPSFYIEILSSKLSPWSYEDEVRVIQKKRCFFFCIAANQSCYWSSNEAEVPEKIARGMRHDVRTGFRN